jgi:hypothetical protein
LVPPTNCAKYPPLELFFRQLVPPTNRDFPIFGTPLFCGSFYPAAFGGHGRPAMRSLAIGTPAISLRVGSFWQVAGVVSGIDGSLH